MGMHVLVEVCEIFQKTFIKKRRSKKMMYALEEAIVNSVNGTDKFSKKN